MGNFSNKKRRKSSHASPFNGSRSNSRIEIDQRKRNVLRLFDNGEVFKAWDLLIEWDTESKTSPSPALWEKVGSARMKQFLQEGRIFRAQSTLDELQDTPQISDRFLKSWERCIRDLKQGWDKVFQDSVCKAIDLELSGATDDPENLKILDQIFVSYSYLEDPEDSIRLADETRAEYRREFTEAQYQQIDQWLDEMYYLWLALDQLGIPDESAEVTSSLKKVTTKSAFIHWKTWIQAWKAYLDNKPKELKKRVEKLPEGSLLCNLGSGLMALTQPDDELENHGANCHWDGLQLLGRMTELAKFPTALPDAEEHWKSGRFLESYKVLKENHSTFPTTSPNAIGAVSDLYFNAAFHTHGDDWKQAIEFLEKLEKNSFESPAEKERTLKSLALALSEEIPAFHLKICWEEYLKSRKEIAEQSPAWTAAAWVWLGRQLAKREILAQKDDSAEERFWENHVGESEAEACFHRALDVDPENLDAHLAILDLLDQKGRSKGRDNALRALLRKFPQEPRALTLAGKVFLANKGLKKALTCLEKASELDPTNTEALQGLMAGYEIFARRAYTREMTELAQETLDKALARAVESGDSWIVSKWSIHASFAALRIWNELDLSLLETSRSKKPAALKAGLTWLKVAGEFQSDSRTLEFFTRCALSFYSKDRDATEEEVQAVKQWALGKGLTGRITKIEVEDLIQLVEIWKYWTSRPEKVPSSFSQETKILEKLFKSVKKFPSNPAGLRPLVDASMSDPALRAMALPLVRTALKSKPDSKHLQFMEWLLANDAPQLQSIEKLKEWKDFVSETKKLMELGESATETNDEDCASEIFHLAHNLRQVWQYEVAGTPGGPAPADVWDPPRNAGPKPDSRKKDFRFDSVHALKILPVAGPRNVVSDPSFFGDPVLTEILEDLAGLSDREFQRLSQSRPVDVPEHVFHQILEMSEKLRLKQKEDGDLF